MNIMKMKINYLKVNIKMEKEAEKEKFKILMENRYLKATPMLDSKA